MSGYLPYRQIVFIHDAEIKETAEQALALAEHRPGRVVMVDIFEEHAAPEGHVLYTEYVQGQLVDEPKVEMPNHIYDENTRLYTSGTTGMLKGVPLNNINDILSAHDVAMHFPTPESQGIRINWYTG